MRRGAHGFHGYYEFFLCVERDAGEDQQNPERHGEDGILEGEGGAGTGKIRTYLWDETAGACFDRIRITGSAHHDP